MSRSLWFLSADDGTLRTDPTDYDIRQALARLDGQAWSFVCLGTPSKIPVPDLTPLPAPEPVMG